jgi:hypothetical protein
VLPIVIELCVIGVGIIGLRKTTPRPFIAHIVEIVPSFEKPRADVFDSGHKTDSICIEYPQRVNWHRIAHTVGGVCMPITFTTCAIFISARSSLNVFHHQSHIYPTTDKTTKQGTPVVNA